MKILTSFLAIILLVISSNVSAKKYKEPTGRNVAYISFSARADARIYTVGFYSINQPSNRSCYAKALRMANINHGNFLDMRTSKLRGIRLLSGKPIAIRSVLSPAGLFQLGCRIDAQFTPKAGHNYRLHVVYAHEKCSITLKEASGKKAKGVRFTNINPC